MIIQELLIHADSEEDTFYQALAQHPESIEKIEHGIKEHQDIKEQIEAIQGTKTHDSKWHKKVEKLQELVAHHVKEEEGSIFRKAKTIFSDEEVMILKEQMHVLKQKLLRKLQRS